MKSYTDISQSKKLAEILPIESADMHCWKRTWKENDYAICVGHSKEWQEGFESKGIEYIPCWSLTALLGVLPEYHLSSPNPLEKQCCCRVKDIETYSNNLVDACVEMIIKLYKQKLL